MMKQEEAPGTKKRRFGKSATNVDATFFGRQKIMNKMKDDEGKREKYLELAVSR